MKLFGEFEAVKFYQENLILITNGGYPFYIYSPRNNHWRQYRNAGNDFLTVSNYDEVTREELMEAMNGVFPKKETDFMRLCHPSQLGAGQMLDILREDYAKYMADSEIFSTIRCFLRESNICHKSYEGIRKLLDTAMANNDNNAKVVALIKELSFNTVGRDIFKREIGIVDGHNGSSYFWIKPVRVIDYEDSNDSDSVAQMESNEISIEEDDVDQYLTPFLYEYFDEEIPANKHRRYASDFEWNLDHNFFTYDQMSNILKDIADTVEALVSGQETEYTKKLKSKKIATEDDTKVAVVVDFYHRFLYRMEYMMKVGKEKGYDLISFMGP